MISEAPDTAELYRRLFEGLATTFGGTIDDVNADAIAYAAAELYHRQVEPRLWEQKSAHELLDLFGVPRAGVFSPYSLTERLVVFRRQAIQSEYVNRAHDLLSSLGVPRVDDDGNDQPLTWRLQRLLATEGAHGAMNNVSVEPAPDADESSDAESHAEAGAQENEQAAAEPSEDGNVSSEAEPRPDGAAAEPDGAAPEPEPVDTAESEPEPVDKAEPEPADKAEPEPEPVDKAEPEAEPVDKAEPEPEPVVKVEPADKLGEGELDVDSEPAAAPLADAVRALEHAARVEAEMSQAVPEGTGGVDLVTLAATLNSVQTEMASLRAMVEALGVELRERLEAIHEEVLTARGVLQPPPGEVVAAPVALQPTAEVPPVVVDEPEPDSAARRRWRRRVLLVILLTLIAFAIAAAIVGLITYGWDRVRSETVQALITVARGVLV